MGSFIYMKKVTAVILTLSFLLCGILQPVPANAENTTAEEKIYIRITAGNQEFSAVFYDNQTTQALLERMPFTLDMNELNGNEKFYYLPDSFPTDTQAVGSIHAGDIMLYGASCLVLFYEDFNTSYRYTPLGYIEDPDGLAKALGAGAVTVSFAREGAEVPGIRDELQKLYENLASTPEEIYTYVSFQDFISALQDAKEILENSAAGADEMQEVYGKLQSAYYALVTLESVFETEIAMYQKPENEKERYDSDSWEAYWKELKEAEDLKETGQYTQEEMEQKVMVLKAAFENLKRMESTIPIEPEEPGEPSVPIEPEEPQKPVTDSQKPVQQEVKIKSIRLSGGVTKLAKGKKVSLKASISPQKASDKNLIWTSSNKKVAAVGKNGVVTGKKKGTAVITAFATDGSGKKGIYRITVVPHAVNKISIKTNSRTLKAGKKMSLKASVSATGKDANKKIIWSSSDPRYASVNSRGVVMAKKAGKGKSVSVTAKATDGSKKKAAIRLKIR